jgi:hypothetical protein
MLMSGSNPKICVFGTHHVYQYKTVRRRYFQNVENLIKIHTVDLVAEEFSVHSPLLPLKISYPIEYNGKIGRGGGDRNCIPKK